MVVLLVLMELASGKYSFKVASRTCLPALVINIEISDLAAEVRRKMVLVYSLQLENTSPSICLIGVMVAKLYNGHAYRCIILLASRFYVVGRL